MAVAMKVNSTTWKNPKAIYVKVGTVWKKVSKVYVKVGTVWKLVGNMEGM